MQTAERFSTCDQPRNSRDEDSELMHRLRDADESALEVLMKIYSPRVMAVAFRVLQSRYEAEEVTQDVFLALWRYPDRFDPARGPLATWLVMLARSRALDLLRQVKAKSRRESHLTSEALISTVNPTGSASPERDLILQEVLQRLPEKQEWVIRNAYFDGYALNEIAARQRLPLGTVKGRVRLAIKRLRSTLAAAV